MFILPCIKQKSQAMYEFTDSTDNETWKRNAISSLEYLKRILKTPMYY